jgi:hypothetical protein
MTGDCHVRILWEPGGEIPPGHPTHRELERQCQPFVWTATADEILAKVRIVQGSIKKLVDNNGK